MVEMKPIWVIVGLFAIVLLLIGNSVIPAFVPAEIIGATSTPPTGFVEMAVSKTNFISSDSKFSGQAMYSMSIAVNGQGRSAIARVGPSQFSGTGSLPSGEFQIQVDELEQAYTYDVAEQNPPDSLYSGSCWWGDWSACNVPRTQVGCGYSSEFNHCWGINYQTSPAYLIANLGQGKTYSKIRIRIMNYNQTVQEIIVDPSQTSVSLGNLGYAYSVGYLLGKLAPPQLDVAFVKPASGGTYSSVAKSGLTVYKSVWATTYPLLRTCPQITGYGANLQITGGCLDATSRLGNELTTAVTTQPISDVNWNCSLSNLTYSCYPNSQAFILEMVLNIKAEFLGINVPVGKPQIESLEIQGNLTARQQGQLLLTVKNVGNDAGAFSAYLACPIGLSAFSTTMTIGPNQTTTVTLPINPVKAGEYDCNISVFDQNRPDVNATRQVTITVVNPACPVYFPCCSDSDPDFQYKLEIPPLVNVTLPDNTTTERYWDIGQRRAFECDPDYVNFTCISHQTMLFCSSTIVATATPQPTTSSVSVGPQVLTAEQKAQLEAQKTAAGPSPWVIGAAIIVAAALAGWWFFLRGKK